MRAIIILACAGLISGAALAQTAAGGGGDDIMQKAINVPGTNWSIYGQAQTNKMIKDSGVPGGQAKHVDVTAKGTNAWDVGALSPIQKPIAAGDAIVIAVWMRAPQLKQGETLPINFVGATGATAPYPTVLNGSVTLTNEWKLHAVAGKSPQAFAGKAAQVSIHLAQAKQSVELGPVFVLDYGPNADPAKLVPKE